MAAAVFGSFQDDFPLPVVRGDEHDLGIGVSGSCQGQHGHGHGCGCDEAMAEALQATCVEERALEDPEECLRCNCGDAGCRVWGYTREPSKL